MGRPVNKRFFGPDQAGKFKILGQAILEEGGSLVDVYIVAQKSSKAFLVTNSPANPPVICRLAAASEDNVFGDLLISVTNGDGDIEYARKIAGRRVVTFDGNVYGWSDVFNAASSTDDLLPSIPSADVGSDAQEEVGELEEEGPENPSIVGNNPPFVPEITP